MSLWTSIRDVLKPVAAVALAPYTGGLSTAAYTAYEQGKNVPATAPAPTPSPTLNLPRYWGTPTYGGSSPTQPSIVVLPSNPPASSSGGGGGWIPDMMGQSSESKTGTMALPLLIGGGMFMILIVVLLRK